MGSHEHPGLPASIKQVHCTLTSAAWLTACPAHAFFMEIILGLYGDTPDSHAEHGQYDRMV